MKDYLLDLIQHTHGLGVIELVKIEGSDTETKISAYAEDKTVIVTGSFKTPVDKTTGEPTGKPDNMKLKITHTGSDYSASFFNVDRTRIAASDVETKFTMGSNVRALIQCTGFWIAAGKFGLSWKLKQMIIDPPSRIGKEYAFDDSEPVSTPTPAPSKKSTPAPVVSDDIADSDGEQESTPAPVVAKEPEAELSSAKKVVRKVVAKK